MLTYTYHKDNAEKFLTLQKRFIRTIVDYCQLII